MCDELGAHPSRSSAPDEVREARPQPRWGVAKRGTDGPARCSSSMSRGVMDGTTANSPPQTAAGRDRMTRPSRRSSSKGAARGFWIRAWGQREPAIQRTGRSSCSAEWLGWLEGGLDIPAKHAECGSLQREHPLRTLTRFAWSRTGRVGKCSICFTSPAPLRRRAARGSSAHRTRPWPQCRSHQGWSAVFSKPQFRDRHERPGFPTANDQISNDLKAALVVQPRAQLHGCATRCLTLRGSA